MAPRRPIPKSHNIQEIMQKATSTPSTTDHSDEVLSIAVTSEPEDQTVVEESQPRDIEFAAVAQSPGYNADDFNMVMKSVEAELTDTLKKTHSEDEKEKQEEKISELPPKKRKLKDSLEEAIAQKDVSSRGSLGTRFSRELNEEDTKEVQRIKK